MRPAQKKAACATFTVQEKISGKSFGKFMNAVKKLKITDDINIARVAKPSVSHKISVL